MNESQIIQPHHLQRIAFLYVRQSTMKQVIENLESSKRQYALRSRAIELGWPNGRIITIDCDQGESGASSVGREGFQRLITEVGMGRAGIVMGLEVSRLARNNADWQRLLQFCSITKTLILDEDGVYDPSNFNDNLLLGIKGTMSEAELHMIKARLRGGILNKVKRGEYCCPLPTGLVYDGADQVVLDPDIQVQGAISFLFETFECVGSASQVVKIFHERNILFPSRLKINAPAIFLPLTFSTVLRTLKNPRYAGVYAYGLRNYHKDINGKRKVHRINDYKEWQACMPNAHPGYITWEQFLENQKILKSNGHQFESGRYSPPRDGGALLQGRVVCGKCGDHMKVRYSSRPRGLSAWYYCESKHKTPTYCQSIATWPIDEAISTVIIEEITPAAIDLVLQIRAEIDSRQNEVQQLHCLALERAQNDADMAKRRFMMVDPLNRLVADTLESDWNKKLKEVEKAQEELQKVKEKEPNLFSDDAQAKFREMTADFQRLWTAPTTKNQDRKRLLDQIIEDVVLIRNSNPKTTTVHIRFKGGKTRSITTFKPLTSTEQTTTPQHIVERIDKLLDEYTYPQIADILNKQGLHPGSAGRTGKENFKFTARHVSYIAINYKLLPRFDRLRAKGYMTKAEIAQLLEIHACTLWYLAKFGLLKRHAYSARGFLYEMPDFKQLKIIDGRWTRVYDQKQEKAKKSKSDNL